MPKMDTLNHRLAESMLLLYRLAVRLSVEFFGFLSPNAANSQNISGKESVQILRLSTSKAGDTK